MGTGPGHGKLVQTQDGDWWVYYLMGRANQGHYTTIGRETGLDPVTWLADDWFIVNDRKGPSAQQTASSLPQCVYEKWTRDDFDREKLNLNWEFVRNPARGSYSLTERPGYSGSLRQIKYFTPHEPFDIILVQKRMIFSFDRKVAYV